METDPQSDRVSAAPSRRGIRFFHTIDSLFGCLFIYIIIPLIPLLLEFLISHAIAQSTLLITIVVFSISLSTDSRSVTVLGLCITISIVSSVLFGISIATKSSDYLTLGYWGISICIFVGIVERITLHVVNKKPIFSIQAGAIL
jgi:hypothetical protein